MLADIGGIACSFKSSVYEDTLQYAPGMVKWAAENIDIVHTMVFILFPLCCAGNAVRLVIKRSKSRLAVNCLSFQYR
jgi:hypothetical protein